MRSIVWNESKKLGSIMFMTSDLSIFNPWGQAITMPGYATPGAPIDREEGLWL